MTAVAWFWSTGRSPAHRGDDVICSGVAAALEPAGHRGALWLGFGGPRRVTADDRTLFGVLCGYLGQALRRAQLFDDSKAVATAMQRSILGPSRTPPGVSVYYAPAVQPLEVGGDWYDAIELSGGRLGLVVGDCVGRGLQAATVMGQLRSACRALLLQTGSPAAVVQALDTFAERIPGAVCTTVFCGVVGPADRSLRYCNAGHLPGVLAGPDGPVQLLSQRQSLPLGILPGLAREESTVTLPDRAALVLYTDGLVERRGESLDVGINRLVEVVNHAGTLAPDELAANLTSALLPAGDQQDDVALVVYRPVAAPAAFAVTLPADISSLSAFRRDFMAWLRDAGMNGQAATEVMVACGEACSNAMEHAYGPAPAGGTLVAGEVNVSATAEEGKIVVTVRDHGRWRQPRLSDEERGRGLKIIRGLMDEVDINNEGPGTEVRFTKSFGDSEGI